MKKQLNRIATLFLAMLFTFSSILSVFAADSGAPEILVTGSGNLLYNGGFEVEGKVLEGWQSMQVVGVDFALNEDAYEGRNALRLEMPASDGGSFVLRPALCDSNGTISGLLPGVYSVSLYAKGSTGTIGIRRKDVGVDQVTEEELPLSSEWKQLKVDGVLVDEKGSIQLEFFGKSTVSGHMMVDGISLCRNPGIENGDFELEEYVKRVPTGTGTGSSYLYKDTDNVLANPGFEAATTSRNVSKAWQEVTEGWMPSGAASSGKLSFGLPEDAHSGAKAFSVTFKVAATEIRLFSANVNPESTAPLAGAYEGLKPDTKYIASFWAKGTSVARVFGKTKTGGNEWGTLYNLKPEEWTLVTKECTSYDTGAYWWNVYLKGDADQYAVIDDIQLVTREQAVRNVAAMIEELDVTADNAKRAIQDIEQWCAALGAENIPNYEAFLSKTSGKYQYKDTGNLLVNPGFEQSATAQNVGAAWQEVTGGWMPDYESKSNMFDFGLSEDAHSGEKAFSVAVKGKERYIRLFSTNVNTKSTTPLAGVYENLEPDTEYIASFWAKGTSVARVYGKTKANVNQWGTPYNLKPEEWTLVTKECTSYDTGAYWWNVFLNGDAGQYAIIDDIQLVTKAQAIENVKAMIAELDIAADSAKQAIQDIEQWCARLGADCIDNYRDFISKKEAYEQGGAAVVPVEDKIPYWTAKDESIISLTEDAVSGKKALKAAFAGAGSVAVTTKDVPFGLGAGYYTLSFHAKGTGKVLTVVKTYSAAGETTVLEKEVNLSSTWNKTVFQGIDIPEGHQVKSLTFTLCAESAGDIFLDAVSMYEELGPGAALDDIVVENRGNMLYFDGAPEGYTVSLYSTSDDSVLRPDGMIKAPRTDQDVSYRYVIVNNNDKNDKAVSQIYYLHVAGTEEEPSEFSQRTVKDADSGITVTGLMKDKAAITVRTLDEKHEYYATALKDGYESIAFYQVYLIPKSAYSGKAAISFPVDRSYNGKEITVVKINRGTKTVEEIKGMVSNGSLTIEESGDGAFMLQLPKVVPANPAKPNTSKPNTTAPNKATNNNSGAANTNTTGDPVNKPEDKPNASRPGDEIDNEQEPKTGKTNSRQKELVILIIVIGAAVILIALAVTATILITRKKGDREPEGAQSEGDK